jgi:hypothetical protein
MITSKGARAIPESPTPRLAIALLLGVAAGLWCYWLIPAVSSQPIANDFTWHWLAGRAILEGHDPYQTVLIGGTYGLNAPYLYPMMTALVVAPFAVISSPVLSAAVFSGVSTALLVWGKGIRDGVVFPLVAGIPFLWAAGAGQISVLAMAGVLIPGLGWLSVLKPNIALALLAYRPKKSLFIGTILLLVIATALYPGWVREYIDTIRGRTAGNYGVPLLQWGGVLIPVVLLRWRRPEAWLILVLACVPQTLLFYDQLPLWLVARTRLESLILALTSWIGFVILLVILPDVSNIAQKTAFTGPVIVATLYLPAAIMVLRRPNEGFFPGRFQHIPVPA